MDVVKCYSGPSCYIGKRCTFCLCVKNILSVCPSVGGTYLHEVVTRSQVVTVVESRHILMSGVNWWTQSRPLLNWLSQDECKCN